MKIAQLAQLWVPVPPKKYGGAALVVSELTEELLRRGHEVTLFASGDSITKAKLCSIVSKSTTELGIDWNDLDLELLNISNCLKDSDSFDIIHGHISASSPAIFLNQLHRAPTVFTLHNNFIDHDSIVQELINQQIQDVKFISLSNNFQKNHTGINYIGNVYNGVNLKKYQFNDQPEDYLAWLGRFDDSKGAKEAVEVANLVGKKLILAGRVAGAEEQSYFDTYIKPSLSKNIEYIGEVDLEEKNKLLGGAFATLIPTNWEEPFGLVTVEAMACGSPVIVFDSGANSEIVKDGVTGYIVPKKDVKKMAECVGNINKINRIDCRRHVEENFSSEKMVDGYESIYRKILKKA